jgi:beta-galactosidase
MIRESFNQNWFFYKFVNDLPVLISGPITLPHDAMLYEIRDPNTRNGFNTGYFPGGTYRYIKTFFCPDEYQEKSLMIEFEGVYRDSEVYINGQLAGGWPYGYTNFYIHIGQYIKFAQENIIEVIVHNERSPNSRWYSGSGIYRNVSLLIGSPVHIPPDGVRITTRGIHQSQALVEVVTTILNKGRESRRIDLKTEFRRLDGEISAVDSFPVTINAGGNRTILRTITIPNPVLWSVDFPNLYTCSSSVLDGGNILDENRETFGIRLLTLDSEKGLCINGQVIKLRGACVHHDNGVIGACTLEAAEERRVRLLKKSGFNALRSAHNPMSKAMLSACDRLGLLVMDEFSDVWFKQDTPRLFAAVSSMVGKGYPGDGG